MTDVLADVGTACRKFGLDLNDLQMDQGWFALKRGIRTILWWESSDRYGAFRGTLVSLYASFNGCPARPRTPQTSSSVAPTFPRLRFRCSRTHVRSSHGVPLPGPLRSIRAHVALAIRLMLIGDAEQRQGARSLKNHVLAMVHYAALRASQGHD